MTYQSEVTADNPVFYFKLDQNTTNSGSYGTFVGSPTYVQSLANTGYGISFTGSQTYAVSGLSAAQLGTYGNHTWEFMIRTTQNDTTIRAIVGSGVNTTNFSLVTLQNGKILARARGGSAQTPSTGVTVISNTTVANGVWHHVAVVWSNNLPSIYIDGALDIAGATALTYLPTNNLVTDIGFGYRGGTSAANYVTADVDELAHYAYGLSSSRVAAHAAAMTAAAVPVNTTVDVEPATSSAKAIEPIAGGAKVIVANSDSDGTNFSDELNANGSQTIVLQFARSAFGGTGSTVRNARLRLIGKSSGSGVSNDYSAFLSNSSGSTPGFVLADTISIGSINDGQAYEWDITSLVQDAYTNSKSDVWVAITRSGASKVSTFYSTESTVAANRPVAVAMVDSPTVNVTVDVATVTGSASAQDASVSTTTGVSIALDSPSAVLVAPDATTEVTSTVSVALDSPGLALSAVEATAETTLDPSVTVDVDSAYAALTAPDAYVSAPTTVDVVTAAVTMQAPDTTVALTQGVVIQLDSPTMSLKPVLPVINNEAILPSEDEDAYFVSTMRSIANVKANWVRFNDRSGNQVKDRAATSVDTSVAGGISNVTLGLNAGPDGRGSAYFNGDAFFQQTEPRYGLDYFAAPDSLEFSFRTSKSTQFIMGGQDTEQFLNNNNGTTAGAKPYEIWLVNGVLEVRSFDYQGSIEARITGFQNLADGKWHHIVFQRASVGDLGIYAAASNRFQSEIFVDGLLEVRRRRENVQPRGFPDYIGGRVEDSYMGGSYYVKNPLAKSDWFVGDISEVVFRQQNTLSEDSILEQRDNFFGIKAIRVDTPRMTMSNSDITVKGNKPRVLVLYLGSRGSSGTWTDPLPEINWVGKNLEQLSRPSVPGVFSALGQNVAGSEIRAADADNVLYFGTYALGGYTDPVTDNLRIMDLDKDINLDDYDMVSVANYPNSEAQWAEYDNLEYNNAGRYKPLRKQLEDLMEQLRKRIVSGLKVWVSDPGTAIALGIIDRAEGVPLMRERAFNDNRVGAATGYYDARSRDIDPWKSSVNPDRYQDQHANNMARVRNLVAGLTDVPGWIVTDNVIWQNVDPFAPIPFQESKKIVDRMKGLQVGDEFFLAGGFGPSFLDWFDTFSHPGSALGRAFGWVAAPIKNVLTGTVVTSFGQTVYNENRADVNPYKDYAVAIVVQPGDKLKGEVVSGKVYCNFTEAWTQWAGFIEEETVQIPIDPSETAAMRAFNRSTNRGSWTATTISSRGTSPAISVNSSGQVILSSSNGGKSAAGDLVTQHWSSGVPEYKVPYLTISNRALIWLTNDVSHDGNALVGVESPQMRIDVIEPTVVGSVSADVTVPTARMNVSAIELRDVTAADATVLVTTPSVSLEAGAFREVVDVGTATMTARAPDVEGVLLDKAEILVLTLPRHSLKLTLEDK